MQWKKREILANFDWDSKEKDNRQFDYLMDDD